MYIAIKDEGLMEMHAVRSAYYLAEEESLNFDGAGFTFVFKPFKKDVADTLMKRLFTDGKLNMTSYTCTLM